jgi:hypothetical protein
MMTFILMKIVETAIHQRPKSSLVGKKRDFRAVVY